MPPMKGLWILALSSWMLVGVYFPSLADSAQTLSEIAHELPHCVTRQEQREVRGASMQGLLESGETIVILHQYYDCRPVRRDDWIVFRHSGAIGQHRLIVKQAIGLPGDKLGMTRISDTPLSTLQINGKPVESLSGKPYYVNRVGASYLGLALRQTRDGIIPRGRYWVLGTAHADGWDSRRFGFIPHQDLLGKAVLLSSSK